MQHPRKNAASRSLNVQSYIDARIMADLAREFKRLGVSHKGSYSHMVNTILQRTHEAWDCEFFETTEEALAWLADENFSIAQFEKDGRHQRRLLTAMQKESLQLDEGKVDVDIERVSEIANLFDDNNKKEE